MLFGVCWNHFQTKTLRGINDVHVLCSWARQLRQIFTAFPEKFGGPDARGERCELLGGQQLWYLGIDRLVQVPDFVFFLGVCFFGSLPFASFVFFNDNSTTPRFFAGF